MKLIWIKLSVVLFGLSLRAEVIEGPKGIVLSNLEDISIGCTYGANEMAPGMSMIFYVPGVEHLIVRWDEGFLSQESLQIYKEELKKASVPSERLEVKETFCRMSIDELIGRVATSAEGLHFVQSYAFFPVYSLHFVKPDDFESFRQFYELRESLKKAGNYLKSYWP